MLWALREDIRCMDLLLTRGTRSESWAVEGGDQRPGAVASGYRGSCAREALAPAAMPKKSSSRAVSVSTVD